MTTRGQNAFWGNLLCFQAPLKHLNILCFTFTVDLPDALRSAGDAIFYTNARINTDN